MMRLSLLAAFALIASPVLAQSADPARLAAQRAAIAKLDRLNGRWRGQAMTQGPGGGHRLVQTERIGNFLDGTIKLIEGHGYNPDGTTGFHAFAVLSYDDVRRAYVFKSHAQGYEASLPFRLTDRGYVWEAPAGPDAIVRYTATITATRWHEVGDRIVAGGPPQRMFEMTLERIGDTDWPQAGGVPMK